MLKEESHAVLPVGVVKIKEISVETFCHEIYS